MPDPYLRRIENGITQNIGVGTLIRIADALGVTVDTLLEDAGVPTSRTLEREAGVTHIRSIRASGEVPTLETYLRLTMGLTDEQIEHVRRTLVALDAERRLAEREVAEEQEPYSPKEVLPKDEE